MKDMFKNTLTLTVIALIAGFLLGFVNDMTKDVISGRDEHAKSESLLSVSHEDLTVASEPIDTDISTGNKDVIIEESYECFNSDGDFSGMVMIINTSEGYNGTIRISLGINGSSYDNSVISGLEFLELNETPGLGMRVGEEEYIKQFLGKNISSYIDSYDAVSGATISSDAVSEAVKQGVLYYSLYTE